MSYSPKGSAGLHSGGLMGGALVTVIGMVGMAVVIARFVHARLLPDQTRADALADRRDVADRYLMAGDHRRAIRLYRKLLPRIDRMVGPDHRVAMDARANLAHAQMLAGHHDRARRGFEDQVRFRQQTLGPDHRDTLEARNSLASVRWEIGDVDEAATMYHQLLTDRVEALGTDHPDTLESRYTWAIVKLSRGELDEAVSLLASVLADRRRVLGDDHSDTLTSQNMLDKARALAADPDGPNPFATDRGAAIPIAYTPIPPEDRDP